MPVDQVAPTPSAHPVTPDPVIAEPPASGEGDGEGDGLIETLKNAISDLHAALAEHVKLHAASPSSQAGKDASRNVPRHAPAQPTRTTPPAQGGASVSAPASQQPEPEQPPRPRHGWWKPIGGNR